MYRIFTQPRNTPFINLGKTNSPAMVKIKELLQTHYQYQQDYYYHFSFYVPAHHILMRLAYVLDGYLSRDVDTVRIVSENLRNICSVLGITSDYTAGKIHHNAFYTSTCIIIAVDYTAADFFIDSPLVWQNIRAVRCLTHQSTSMEVRVPVIIKERLDVGLAAVGIDIPLLAYQLKQWDMLNKQLPVGAQESVEIFLSKYVIPGMVKEQIDIALRNRLPYIATQTTPTATPRVRAFVTAGEEALVNPIYQVLKTVNTSRNRYGNALQSIPMMFAENYLQAVPVEIAALSSFSYWATYLIMLDWLYPMAIFLQADQRDVTDIEKVLKRVDRFTSGTNCLKYIPDELQAGLTTKLALINTVYRK